MGNGVPRTTLRLFRFNPAVDSRPRWEILTLDVPTPITLMMALARIQETQDSTLSFREFACPAGPGCGSCLLRVNSKTVYGCNTVVRGGEELTVEPLAGYPVIKDLVCDFGLDWEEADQTRWHVAEGAHLRQRPPSSRVSNPRS